MPERRTERQIVGLGGGGDTPEQTRAMHEYILGLTSRERPRLLYVPTAIGDADSGIAMFYERFALRWQTWKPFIKDRSPDG